jgi:uncharacterized protein YndB with AHSA1/START domain
LRIVESITIERPPAEVWAVVADLESHPAWRPALRELRQVSDGPLGVGTRIREVLEWRGRELVIDDLVTAFDPPRRLGLHGEWPGGEFDLELVLEPEREGTRVTMDWPFRPRSLLARIATPFLGGAMRRATREELALLKARLESPPTG